MSAAYAIGGALVGAFLARISPAEPLWFLVLAPAAACFAIAWCGDWGRPQ